MCILSNLLLNLVVIAAKKIVWHKIIKVLFFNV